VFVALFNAVKQDAVGSNGGAWEVFCTSVIAIAILKIAAGACPSAEWIIREAIEQSPTEVELHYAQH
jgi:hypothetical protein